MKMGMVQKYRLKELGMVQKNSKIKLGIVLFYGTESHLVLEIQPFTRTLQAETQDIRTKHLKI